MLILKRCIHSSSKLNKIIPDNLKNKSVASQKWLYRQLNDPFVTKARYENYRARSAFKLIEMNDKFKLLKPGMVVLDCGASPGIITLQYMFKIIFYISNIGAWTQVMVRKLKLDEDSVKAGYNSDGLVIGVDLRPINAIEGAVLFGNMDFTKPLNQGKILSSLNGRKVDLICSDMSPNISGVKSLDHEEVMNLCYSALKFAVIVLKPGSGIFVTKFFQGSSTENFRKMFHKFFLEVRCFKPRASRDASSEEYMLGFKFKGLKDENNV